MKKITLITLLGSIMFASSTLAQLDVAKVNEVMKTDTINPDSIYSHFRTLAKELAIQINGNEDFKNIIFKNIAPPQKNSEGLSPTDAINDATLAIPLASLLDEYTKQTKSLAPQSAQLSSAI